MYHKICEETPSYFLSFLVLFAFNYIWFVFVYRGYYPQGGGEVIVRMSPVKELSPIDLTERGAVTKIYGRAFVAGALPIKVSAEKSLGSIQLHKSI